MRQRICPECGSYETHITAGRELEIASIEVDLPVDSPIGSPDDE